MLDLVFGFVRSICKQEKNCKAPARKLFDRYIKGEWEDQEGEHSDWWKFKSDGTVERDESVCSDSGGYSGEFSGTYTIDSENTCVVTLTTGYKSPRTFKVTFTAEGAEINGHKYKNL